MSCSPKGCQHTCC